ncbi:MAG: CobD/CbiB family cobalamin biosynthesis protein [Acidimicrobiales bacterium]
MNRAFSVGAGLLADRLLGEPPPRLHPLPWFGRAVSWLERVEYRDDVAAGVLHCVAGTTLAAGAGTILSSVGTATYLAVGGNSLLAAARDIAQALERGEPERARRMLPSLVGRDPSMLDEKEMARAVVESVAENTNDAVVAPVVWAISAGAPGALWYRAVNTLDAMVGSRSERYERFGRASARMDDFAGWVPARVTAALVALVRPRSAVEVLRVTRTDAPAHPSPNAGVCEGAFAAALGLRLGGENRYGDRLELRPPLGIGRAPEVADIERAVRLSRDVSSALAVILALLGALSVLRTASSRRARERRCPGSRT